MSLNPQVATASKVLAGDAALDALLDQCDGGFLKIYDGTQPTNPNTALGAQVLLAALALGDPAFGAAAAGSKTAEAITDDEAAAATGTASWYSLTKSDGTRIYENTAGEAGDSASLTLDDKTIEAGGVVSVSSLVISSTVA